MYRAIWSVSPAGAAACATSGGGRGWVRPCSGISARSKANPGGTGNPRKRSPNSRSIFDDCSQRLGHAGIADPAEGGGVGYSHGRSPFYEIVIGGSIARTQVQHGHISTAYLVLVLKQAQSPCTSHSTK